MCAMRSCVGEGMVGDHIASRHGNKCRRVLQPVAWVVLISIFTSPIARSQEVTTATPWITTVIDRHVAVVQVVQPEPGNPSAASAETRSVGAVAAPPGLHGAPGPQPPASVDGASGQSEVAFVPEFAGGLADSLRFSLDTHSSLVLSLLALVLASSLLYDFGAVVVAYAANVRSREGRQSRSKVAGIWDEAEGKAAREECNRLVNSAADLWRRAEPVVLRLEQSSALRSFLIKELGEVTKRLSAVSTTPDRGNGAVMVGAPAEYWIMLRQRLRRAVRDLERIRATADAALSTFGGQDHLPRIPESKTEALVILGANREIDAETLQRLVKALRQCWHPDLAHSDEDRVYRNARITQINVAYDILTGRRAEG